LQVLWKFILRTTKLIKTIGILEKFFMHCIVTLSDIYIPWTKEYYNEDIQQNHFTEEFL
jgi:hypothetical protein